MIVFLNYLPAIMLATGMGLVACLLWAGKHKASLIVAVSILVLLLVLKAVTPSYMPKGTVPKLPLVVEQEESPPMQNRILKPEMTKEERDAHFKQQFDAVKK